MATPAVGGGRPPFSEDTASPDDVRTELRRYLTVDCTLHEDVAAAIDWAMARCPWVGVAMMGPSRRFYTLEQFFGYVARGLDRITLERDDLRRQVTALEKRVVVLETAAARHPAARPCG